MDRRRRGYIEQHRLERFVAPNQIDRLTVREVPKGQSIIEIGQPVDALMFFVDGRARVFMPSAKGGRLLLCFYEPLQIFGDLEIVGELALATTTVEAIQDCVVLTLERDYVAHSIASDCELSRRLAFNLARKLDRVIRNGTLNLLHPVEERLASYILATATVDGSAGLIFEGNLTQIAEQLGTSFRHLHRILGGMCEEGLLLKRGHAYRVIRPATLRERAAGVYILGDG